MTRKLISSYRNVWFCMVVLLFSSACTTIEANRTSGNANANGIQIAYETFGEPTSPPLLLVMGLGSQMIRWEVEFCEMFVQKGLYVIRFDNRDVGLSSKIEGKGVTTGAEMMQMLGDLRAKKEVAAPYTLDDMADDAVGLLDALGIEKANICGVSMGGMIVQTMAIRHPNRVKSMVSIMSTTGNPDLPPAQPQAMRALFSPAAKGRDAAIERRIKINKVIGSPGFTYNEEKERKKAALSYDRSHYPQGRLRQTIAIVAHGNRKPALSSVTTPTLVIHGSDDPLVPLAGGKDTAEAIPGAKLLVIKGLGHDLPEGAWPQLVDAIASHIQAVK